MVQIPDTVRKAAYDAALEACKTYRITDVSKLVADAVIFVIEDHPDMVLDPTQKNVEHRNIFQK
ncbi:MAG: hypothetical protein ABWY25_06090 [Paenisporosarcina sp.]